MKLKFEPDVDLTAPPPGARLIDPEAYDASEQSFAASLDEESESPKFVADTEQDFSSNHRATNELPSVNPSSREPLDPLTPSQSAQSEPVKPPDLDSWRNEVADRVNNYRARRRPRAPRYPSLQLKFDPPEPSWNDHTATVPPAAHNRLAVAIQDNSAVRQEEIQIQPTTEADALDMPAGGRILEFPRFAPPPPVFDGLAEPVAEQPRILEVPELLPPPPALGGIMMDPVEEPAKERRPGFELPLQAAPMSRRVLAGAIDALLVSSAFALFAYIFFRVTSIAPPLQSAATISIILTAVFWTSYQYLLLVYTGSTPGLRLARLQLSRFDGTAVPRKMRRWRVLAAVLSGLSFAVGYAWCFLDEDRLCWHDRITRTYMAPRSHPHSPAGARKT
jgi:uncharacterized RDD family membrane protein YckC